MIQSTDKLNRYKPVNNKIISPGDICLLVEPQTKRSNYPLAKVELTNTNSLGEVTSAILLKGKTGERVFRHTNSLIPLITCIPQNKIAPDGDTEKPQIPKPSTSGRPSTRAAASAARRKLMQQIDEGLI